MSSGRRLQRVHLRVNDSESNQPTPCRIRISDSEGREFAPLGQPLEFPIHRGESVGGRVRIGGHRWFSIPGACEIELPPGELRVQICKGINYFPVDEHVNLLAGKMALRFAIRCADAYRKTLFMSIDTRCHFLPPHEAALDAAAENVDIANLLCEPMSKLGVDGNVYQSVPNLNAFSGQSSALAQHGLHVIVNSHNRHPVLGSLGLLHSHRPVFPLNFGAPDYSDDWSLRDWAGQCHRKGGLVVWTEPFAPNKPHAGESLALAILGEIDAYELTPDNMQASLRGWYQLLNAGVRVPIVGGSGRVANNRPLGAMQTAVGAHDGNWIDAIRNAGTKVTNGPHVNLTLEGDVAIVSALAIAPYDRLELIVNGNKVAESESKEVDHLWVANLNHTVPADGWVAARVLDTRKSFLDETTPLFAHTSAQWIGEPERDPKAVAFLLDHLEKARDWVGTQGRFEEPKSKVKLLATFDEAKAKLQLPPEPIKFAN